MVFFVDMGSVLTKLLRRSKRGGFAQATNLVSELADPQLTAVFAESQARGVSVTTLLTR